MRGEPGGGVQRASGGACGSGGLNGEFWGRGIVRLLLRARAFMLLSCTMRKCHRTPESPLPPLRAVRTPVRLLTPSPPLAMSTDLR